MSRELPRPCVCLITDRRRVAASARTAHDEVVALERWLDEAIDVVDLIQVRERDLPDGRLHDLVRDLVSRAEGSRTRVLVNDRADVAMAAGAAGVHLRADGVPASQVRRLGGSDWIVGRSTHAAGEATDGPSESRGPALDYVLFGSVFAAATKSDGVYPAQGLDGLAAAVVASRCPVLAIGGVTAENAPACARAGAAGAAAIGLFVTAGIRRAAESLRAAWCC